MYAAHDGNADAGSLLIDAGANLDAIRNDGATALMLAARHGEVTVVKLLTEAGCNVDAKDKKM